MSYTPKSKLNIKQTNGKDFQRADNKKPYVGKYIELSNGKMFAGNDPNNPGVELHPLNQFRTKYGNKDIVSYRNLNKKISYEVDKFKDIPFAKNAPTEDDYEQGYFFRHFIHKVNEPFSQSTSEVHGIRFVLPSES